MNQFREPTENEEDFKELVRLDRESFLEQVVNPFPEIECPCGRSYTLEMHTVCPYCFRRPGTNNVLST